MRFGLENRKVRTGADLYVAILQIASLLPGLFLIVVPGYPSLLTRRRLLSELFRYGLAALPRAEALGLSLLYRVTASEVVVFFVMVGGALIFGLAAKKLTGKLPRGFRIACAALIAADLVLRALPLHCNAVFSPAQAIVGGAVRAICLALLLLDLRAGKQKQ